MINNEERERLECFERILRYHKKIARNKRLSLAAKGLMLVLNEVVPFACDINKIKEMCNSDEKEIYSALCELAFNGNICYKDIALFLGVHIGEEKSEYDF